eukprot:6477070-Amphidinium_carterae.1
MASPQEALHLRRTSPLPRLAPPEREHIVPPSVSEMGWGNERSRDASFKNKKGNGQRSASVRCSCNKVLDPTSKPDPKKLRILKAYSARDSNTTHRVTGGIRPIISN